MTRILSLLFLCLPGPALAGGYFFTDPGIVAMGRGGAWTASADTQFAQAWNPAALANIERPQINLGWVGLQRATRFDPDFGDSEVTDYPEVRNEAGLFSVPQAGYATPAGKYLHFAFGLYTPYAPANSYPREGGQRYSVVDSAVYVVHLGPSLAVTPIRQISIGAGVNYTFFWMNQSLALSNTGEIDPSSDVYATLRARDMVNFGWNLGLLVSPIPEISIGASIYPSMRYRNRGNLEVDFTGNTLESLLDSPTFTDGTCDSCTGDGVALEIITPYVVRTGVAFRPLDGLEIEAGWSWQNWSAMPDVTVSEIDIAVTAGALAIDVAEELTIPQRLKDSHSIRLGGSYIISQPLELRLGASWNTGSMSPQEINVYLPDANNLQLGTGATPQ